MSDFRDRMRAAKEQAKQALNDLLASSDPSTTSEPSGDAVSPDARVAAPSATAGRSASGSSGTPVGGTAPPSSETVLPFSTTPATNTPSDSRSFTVWQENLSGFVERGSPLQAEDLHYLSESLRSSLHALATGRGEPVEAVIQQIAEYFYEEEATQCEGSLIEAVDFYMTQMQLPA